MRAQGIVKGFNIGENIRLSSTAGVIPAQVNQFTFETAEKVFRNSVVVGVASKLSATAHWVVSVSFRPVPPLVSSFLSSRCPVWESKLPMPFFPSPAEISF